MTQNLQLHNITNRLLDAGKNDYQELFKVSKAYFDFLVKLIDLDPDAEQNRSNRKHFDNGYAIGLTWAAMCIKDLMRTKRFVDGLYQAVCDVHKNKGANPSIFFTREQDPLQHLYYHLPLDSQVKNYNLLYWK